MSVPVAELTAVQQELFQFLCSRSDNPPTFVEMAHHLGFRSTSTVSHHVGVLEDAGLITRGEGWRSIRVVEPAPRRRWVFPCQPGREVQRVETEAGEFWARRVDPDAPDRVDLDRWIPTDDLGGAEFTFPVLWPDLVEMARVLTDATPEVER